MFSLQRILGRPGEFFGLLEQSAALGAESVKVLKDALTPAGSAFSMEALTGARRQDKEVIARLEVMLSTVFITPLEREDLESIGNQLYRLPKAVEKFAERYNITHARLADVDFSVILSMLESAARIVTEMVQSLSQGCNLGEIKSLDARLSQIEADAGKVILDCYRRVYEAGGDPLKGIIVRDLFGFLSDCIEVCRDIGRTISLVIYKNS